MKEFFKRHYKKFIIFPLDFILIAGFIICRPISAAMLSVESECLWNLLNMKCATCGGTHFVNDFTSFRFVDAFLDHPYFFVLSLYVIVSLVFLNMFMIYGSRFAAKALRIMYNLYFAAIAVLLLALFTIGRNLPAIIELMPKFIEIITPK